MRHTQDKLRTPSAGSRRAPAPRRRRLVRRLLFNNISLTVAAIGALSALVLNMGSFGFMGEDKAPPLATENMSAGDMLALLERSDMDAMQARVIANAKRRAYEQQVKEEREARKKAEWYRRNKTKIEASRTAANLRKINPSSRQNKAYGKQMNKLKGWSGCWSSLETLWDHESGWNERAENPSSGAYGIPQSLPGSKMATAGSDWRSSSPTQIAWGLGYIKARYRDPCGAWSFWQAHHWY